MKTKLTYLSNGTFTLLPEYDETVQYNFEKGEFDACNFDESGIDWKSAHNDESLLRDIRSYNLNKRDELMIKHGIC